MKKQSQWIVDNSETYTFIPQIPVVLTLSQEELNFIFFGWDDYRIGMKEENNLLPTAGYIPSGIMLISEDFDINTDQSHILHEMVHHFQASYNVEAQCLRALEPEAYELQAQYVEEFDLKDDLPDAFTQAFLSSCNRYD